MHSIQDVDISHDASASSSAAGHPVAGLPCRADGMTGNDPFALQQSALNDFLFAEIGTEPNGMPLSLLSAFARGGKDPWQEAQRLAELPGHLAVSGLAGLIAASGAQRGPEATTMAQNLVKLLPGPHQVPAVSASEPSWSKWQRLLRSAMVLVAFMLTAAILAGGDLRHPAAGPAPASVQSPIAPAAPPGPPGPTQVPTGD